MRKLKIIVLTCIILNFIIGYSYGEINNAYEIKMEVSKEELLVGETIKIPVRLENANLEEGIVIYGTLLGYDQNVFEEPQLIAGEQWDEPYMVENFIQSTTADMQPTKRNQEIVTLSFKVKDNAQLGKTRISLSKFEASDGEKTIPNSGDSIELNITSNEAKVANVIVDNMWFNKKNMVITTIISVGTLITIIVLTIYYLKKRENK